MSSRALNTSDAEMLLCCLEVETSCALPLSRQKNTYRASEKHSAYVAAAKYFYQQKKVDVDGKGQSVKLLARTKVIDKHRRALD